MRQVLFVLAILASSAGAQGPIDVGSRVRLIPEAKYEPRRAGRVVSLAGDSVLVRFEPVPEVELRAEALSVARARLEVNVYSRRHPGTGAILGAIVGGVGGWIAGSRMKEQQCYHSYWQPTIEQCDDPVSYGGIVGLAGAIAGTGTGAI